MSFRSIIEAALEVLCSDAIVQRKIDFPPEEFRLAWEEGFCVLEGNQANPDALGSFDTTELVELRRFDAFIRSLPPESDTMWHRDNLDADPWPEIRTRARDLSRLLKGSGRGTAAADA